MVVRLFGWNGPTGPSIECGRGCTRGDARFGLRLDISRPRLRRAARRLRLLDRRVFQRGQRGADHLLDLVLVLLKRAVVVLLQLGLRTSFDVRSTDRSPVEQMAFTRRRMSLRGTSSATSVMIGVWRIKREKAVYRSVTLHSLIARSPTHWRCLFLQYILTHSCTSRNSYCSPTTQTLGAPFNRKPGKLGEERPLRGRPR
jgi:hypothetical protein